jgi:uncharacterized protein YhjY with autotransporter beta-barrel domain
VTLILNDGLVKGGTNGIVGADDDIVIVVGDGKGEMKIHGVTGAGITLSGEIFEDGATELTINSDGVVLGGTDGVVVTDNFDIVQNGGSVTGTSGDGYRLDDDNDLTIGGGTVTGGDDGIDLTGTGGGGAESTLVTINGGTITGNSAGKNGVDSHGIVIGAASAENDTKVVQNGGLITVGGGDKSDGVHIDGTESDGSAIFTQNGGTIDVRNGRDGVHFDADGNVANPQQLLINGTVLAGDDGVEIMSNFNVTVGVNGDIGAVNNGVEGKNKNTVSNLGNSIYAGGDGIQLIDGNVVSNSGLIVAVDDGVQVGANNNITNTGDIYTGVGATAGSHGVELQGADNNVTNAGGTIDTTGGVGIDNYDWTKTAFTPDTLDDTGAGGDGIHAKVDNQLLISNEDGGTIIAEDDGIDIKSGNVIDYLTKGGAEQKVQNIEGSTITAKDNGIIAENFTVVYNGEDSTITADSDGSYWSNAKGGSDGTTKPAGINVQNQNTVLNDGLINGNGDGIHVQNLNGFGWGSVTNSAIGVIDVGGNGIEMGSMNNVTNAGLVTGDVNGMLVNGGAFNLITNTGTLTGGGNGKNGGNSDGAGLNFTNSSNNTFLGSTGVITSQVGSGGDGIQINNSSTNSIIAGAVTGDDDGIEIVGGLNNALIVGAVEGRDGHGVNVVGSSNNSIISSGGVKGEDDGVHIESSTQITVLVTGSITGEDGDGVDISGGGNNSVTATGAITGDPGVLITSSSNNTVSGASISGTDGGVVINKGSNNTVTATTGNIDGNTDADGDGRGVDVTGGSNVISANGDITGQGGVYIAGDGNKVSSASVDGSVGTGSGDGVNIAGSTNTVTTGNIKGDGDGIEITSGSNNVITANNVTGLGGAGALVGSGNTLTANNIDGKAGIGLGAGDGSTVTANNIDGSTDGVVIGNSNIIDANNINGKNGDGLVAGNGNDITANNIDGKNGDGADLGNSNILSANNITGSGDGLVLGSNNDVEANNIKGKGGDGVDIDGTGNVVKASGAITGSDDGVLINGDSNSVSSASIDAGDDGIEVTGDNNTVSTGAITAGGEGVDLTGDSNNVDASSILADGDGFDIDGDNNSLAVDNDIVGDANKGGYGSGGFISGNNNTVTAGGSIYADNDGEDGGDYGVYVQGANNTVTAGGDILGWDNEGVYISGNGNEVSAGGQIASEFDDGVVIFGNNNDVDAEGIEGYVDGAYVNGNSNNITVGEDGIAGLNDDGVELVGNGNSVVSGGSVGGYDDGVVIDGDDNSVAVTGNITGTTGDGVDISGDGNDVTATGNISGDPGVVIVGNQNNVAAGGDIIGVLGGAIVTGNQNTVTAGDDIETTDGYGAGITGNQNSISAADDIKSTNSDAANISGNQNQVSANDFIAGEDGVEINGNQNTVDVGASITAGANGVWFNSGTGNNVDLTGGVSITAGWDGILVDVDGNNFSHDANTSITAGDDGIEFEYGGLVNAYESLVWLGTINAADDGIVADQGFWTIINNGSITGDSDKNSDGNGITVTSDNTVENNGSISGWNGIVGDDRNVITNDGTITATNDGIQVDDDNKVINNGTITAGDDGIQVGDNNYVENNSSLTINAKDNGIEAGDGNEIVNNGVINADTDDNNDGDGIQAGNSNEITNTGEINGWNGIVAIDFNTVTSSGEINAENDGINVDDENTVTNSGTINAGQDGIQVDNLNTVSNSGTITSDDQYGINANTNNTVTNSGTVQAQSDAVGLGSGNVLTNTGFIYGDTNVGGIGDGVQINGNSNAVTNSGTIRSFGADGIDVVGNSNDITNNSPGTIRGEDNGIEISGASNEIWNYSSIVGDFQEGVLIGGGSSNYLYNWGTVTGGDDGVQVNTTGNGIYNYGGTIRGLGGDGVDLEAGFNYVYNTGLIDGDGDSGVEGDGGNNQIDNYGTIVGADDGVDLDDNNNVVNNYNGSITGQSDDGVDLNGNNNTVYNTGSITGADEGIEIDGDKNTVTNGTFYDDAASIVGLGGDGIDAEGDYLTVTNWGLIQGFWEGIDHDGDYLVFTQVGGTTWGQNSHGIETRDNAVISNSNGGEDGNQGQIIGEDDGVNAGDDLDLTNGLGALILGEESDGIEFEGSAYIENAGTIQGGVNGINHTEGAGFTEIVNWETGTITGSEAGYFYSGSAEDGEDYISAAYVPVDVEIWNFGTIQATGMGVMPTPLKDDPDTKDVDESKLPLDFINGEDADPVAAIDTHLAPANATFTIFNWGVINGANEFSDPVADDPETEVDETAPSKQLTNRFAILGGASEENVANFAGGVINGDVYLQGGDDVFAMEIGSDLNGTLNLGQTLINHPVLTAIKDDPATKDVDESKGGTAFEFAMSTSPVDMGIDAVILFGQGTDTHAGNIVEAEVLYVDDMLTQSDFTGEDLFAPTAVVDPENGPFVVDPAQAAKAPVPFPVPAFMPIPDGTWNLNGNVTIDGALKFTLVKIDGDGDGVLDEETDSGDETVALVDGTVGTVVNNGRLNVGGTFFLETPGIPSDEEEGEYEVAPTYQWVTNKTAVLTSPVVDVLSGGTLGGHGTIRTNPGAVGGNGGVNLSGKVQGEIVTILNPHDLDDNPVLKSEARGSLILGMLPYDLVTQDADGKVIAQEPDDVNDFKIDIVDEEPVKTDLLAVQDGLGNIYSNIKLPENFSEEVFNGPFDFVTDSPRYATLAPGDEINRIGTLTVFGNVKMDGRQTGFTTFVSVYEDDPETEADESKTVETKGREVVTNWGSQFQADLKADGKGDLLLVKKTGTSTAIVGSTFDITGPGTADLVTQDDEGTVTDATKGDGVLDFEFDDDDNKVNKLYPGKGGPDGKPDGVQYLATKVADGAVVVDGRLDIRLDGQFVDTVNNGEPATIPDPDNTGCGNDPDNAPSCPQIPNPDYKVPDGIADVDAKGNAIYKADFSKDAKVWDIIIAEGGVTGKFDEKGFDGGPNDGALVVRYDDPSTEADEEVRVQLLKAYLQYLPDRVRIISIPNFEPKGQTLNQTLTGEYLDSLTKYGLNEDSLHGIIALVGTATDIPAALDALHPEWYNAFNEVGFSIARGAEQQAYIRTIEAQGLSGGSAQRVVMKVGGDAAVGAGNSDKRATFWLSGAWSTADVESNDGFLEYDYQILTGYAGFDYMVNQNLLIGILGGFGNTDVDFDGRDGEGDVDHWQVGGYISYLTDTWFLNAGGGMGDLNIESMRDIDFGSSIGSISRIASADYDGDVYYFYGKGGYSFDTGNGFKITPEVGLTYAKVKQDGFEETGANEIDLIVDAQSVESIRGTAQIRFSKTFRTGNGGGWMPYARVGVAHEFEDDLRPISSRFRAAPGTSFTVFGEVPRETTAIFGVGVTGQVSEMFTLFLDYSGELGGDYSEHAITGGARIKF